MSALRPLPAAALVAAVLVPMSPAGAAPLPTCHGERATIVGTPAPDHMTGTPGDDVIVSLGGDDVVLGRGGDDLVCGGDGADALRGGPGADRLYGQREARVSDRGGTSFVADLLDGGAGDDLLVTGGDDRWVDHGSHGVLDYTRSPAGVTVDLAAGTATGQGSDTLVLATGPECGDDCFATEVLGSPYDDVLSGTDDGDELVGNAGGDRLDGRGGADVLFPDGFGGSSSGDDVVEGGPGDDLVSAFAGRDRLSGGDGDDTVWATRGGPSEVHGDDGDDEVVVWFATAPGFVLDGGAGTDRAQVLGPGRAGAGGRPDAATLTMADGRVVADDVTWGTVTGTEDLGLYAELGWTYEGTDAAEVLRSAGTWLHATTYAGDDEVWGTDGADRIEAGDGTDTVRGGPGRDTCLDAEDLRSCEVTG